MKLCNLENIDELRVHIRNLLLKGLEISLIISFIDPHCYTASLLDKEFGLGSFSPEAIGNMLDKILSRKIVEPLNFAPSFAILRENLSYASIPETFKGNFPFILKYPNSMGSKDVFKVTGKKHFNKVTWELSQKYPGQPVLIEEFLDGPQYLAEVVVYQNEVHIMAIFQQEITFQQKFIITGYSLMTYPPAAFLEKFKGAVETIVKAHGMETGACHLEIRQACNGFKLIEINPRISGGGMNRLIECGLGLNLVEETIKMALGQKPDLQPRRVQNVFAQYITVPQPGILKEVTGKNKAIQCPGVLEVYIKPQKGTFLKPPLSMGNRYAYVIAAGETDEKAKENAKYGASQIQFHLQTTEETPDNDLTQENYADYKGEFAD